jgi:hypothetical protein
MSFETDGRPIPAGTFDDVLSLIRLVTDMKTYGKRLENVQAEMAKADASEAAIHQCEFEQHTKSQLVEGRHRELSAYARHLSEIEDQIKQRLLRHVGALEYYNPAIQQMPDWAAVDRELGAGSGDPHFSGNDTTTAREQADGAPERLPEAPAIATVTRTTSRGAGRRIEH